MVAKLATGEIEEKVDQAPRSAAAELGARGGKARAAKLTKEQRAEIARKAAAKRWGGNAEVTQYPGDCPGPARLSHRRWRRAALEPGAMPSTASPPPIVIPLTVARVGSGAWEPRDHAGARLRRVESQLQAEDWVAALARSCEPEHRIAVTRLGRRERRSGPGPIRRGVALYGRWPV